MLRHRKAKNTGPQEAGEITHGLSLELLDCRRGNMHRSLLSGWWIVPSAILGAYIWWNVFYAIVGFVIQ